MRHQQKSRLTQRSVVLMAALRLWSGLKYNNTITMYDFTWWWPEVLIFSCLEVDFAIMCASMPIFWPTVMAAWTEIFVTSEVVVTNDRLSQYIDPQTNGMKSDQSLSLKSHTSTESLTRNLSQSGTCWYNGLDSEMGRGLGTGITETKVHPSEPKANIL